MNWEAVGSIAEALGVVFVLVSILYLAIQIKQNTNTIKSGSHGSHIATLVERQTRYVMLTKVEDKTTARVVSSLIKQAGKLPNELYKSLTWDRGPEMSGHKEFTLATDIQVYFCDPKSPWQRGSNGNTNRLLRQYFPKGTDLWCTLRLS